MCLGCAQVCDGLGVELEVVPMTQAYWEKVVSHSVSEIREGRTPNPDMLCNSRVKFGAFYEYLERTYGSSFDRCATRPHAACACACSLQTRVAASCPFMQPQQALGVRMRQPKRGPAHSKPC